MALIDNLYKDLLFFIANEGFTYADKSRNNVELVQVPHYVLEIPIANNYFPLLTTKKINWQAVAHELIWMLSGSNNISYLKDNNVNIWNADAANFSGSDYVGPIYGSQWRFWNKDLVLAHTEKSQPKLNPNSKSELTPIDQIKVLINGLKTDLFNRRHLVTAWNPSDLHLMALPPCHWSFEILPEYRYGEICFILKWHQRSVDTFLGLPFDIASYAFLGKIIEQLTGYTFYKLIGDLSNVHIYKPHFKAVTELLGRNCYIDGPNFKLGEVKSIDEVNIDLFYISDYNPLPFIKAELFTQTTKATNENK